MYCYLFFYVVEVGFMEFFDEEVVVLCCYLDVGGFLVIDDFWGVCELCNLVKEMCWVLLDCFIVDVLFDYLVFYCFYDVNKIV